MTFTHNKSTRVFEHKHTQVPERFASVSNPFGLASALLVRFGQCDTPAEAAATLLLAVKAIYVEARIRDKQVLAADDLLPILAYCSLIANQSEEGFLPHQAIRFTLFCGGFDNEENDTKRSRARSQFLSEVQYYITSLQCAVLSVESYAVFECVREYQPASLIHTTRKSLENQRSNVNSIMTKTQVRSEGNAVER